MSQTAVGFQNVRFQRTCNISSCSCNEYSSSKHPGWRKSLNGQKHPSVTHPFLPCCPMHLASHVCCHYTSLSTLTEGWGSVTDLSSVPLKRTTDNFAFEGLNMHKRPKRVRAGGGVTIVWPQNTNTHIHSHWAADGRMLVKANCELPLLSSVHYWGQLGGRHSFFSAFRGKQKRVWDPSYTHVHVFKHTHKPPPSQILSVQLWDDNISEAHSLPASRLRVSCL